MRSTCTPLSMVCCSLSRTSYSNHLCIRRPRRFLICPSELRQMGLRPIDCPMQNDSSSNGTGLLYILCIPPILPTRSSRSHGLLPASNTSTLFHSGVTILMGVSPGGYSLSVSTFEAIVMPRLKLLEWALAAGCMEAAHPRSPLPDCSERNSTPDTCAHEVCRPMATAPQ